VKITQAHCAELGKRLKEQHSHRNLPECDGGEHNVQSVKQLDVLRLTFLENAASPRHPDNNEDRVGDDDDPEASNEDGFGINSFPFTLSFLDLSTLGFKEEVSDRLPLPFFLRQEYDGISALIKKESRNKNGFGDSQWSTWNG